MLFHALLATAWGQILQLMAEKCNTAIRANGRRYTPTLTGEALQETLPEFWYEGWHPLRDAA